MHIRLRPVGLVLLVATAFVAAPAGVSAEEQGARYRPSQINHPVPKFDYTDEGRPIMLRRNPYCQIQGVTNFNRYRWVENTHGVEHVARGAKLKREPREILSEEQREILREWGQPDYLRGPTKSTLGDSVTEWAYHSQNKLFQFVDRKMVYHGPLTDQDRTSITYGAPKVVLMALLEPNIRRETWIYYPTYFSGHEMIFSFTNGKLTYQQEQGDD